MLGHDYHNRRVTCGIQATKQKKPETLSSGFFDLSGDDVIAL